MTLTGVGVLLIGVALLVLAIFAAQALHNLASVLREMEKTVGKLPDQLDDMFKETGQLIRESNQTIADVNHKLEQLSPLFYVVGDVGKVTHTFSSSLVNFAQSIQEKAKYRKQ
ncbi:MAG TPA: DUF948 domain-containing protein [Bacillota bacterium]